MGIAYIETISGACACGVNIRVEPIVQKRSEDEETHPTVPVAVELDDSFASLFGAGRACCGARQARWDGDTHAG